MHLTKTTVERTVNNLELTDDEVFLLGHFWCYVTDASCIMPEDRKEELRELAKELRSLNIE